MSTEPPAEAEQPTGRTDKSVSRPHVETAGRSLRRAQAVTCRVGGVKRHWPSLAPNWQAGDLVHPDASGHPLFQAGGKAARAMKVIAAPTRRAHARRPVARRGRRRTRTRLPSRLCRRTEAAEVAAG